MQLIRQPASPYTISGSATEDQKGMLNDAYSSLSPACGLIQSSGSHGRVGCDSFDKTLCWITFDTRYTRLITGNDPERVRIKNPDQYPDNRIAASEGMRSVGAPF